MQKTIRGLRTQEPSDFVKFFERVQERAIQDGNVFFLDTAQGNDLSWEDMDVTDLSGWLLPSDRASEFEIDFVKHNEWKDGKWNDFYTWLEWDIVDDKLMLEFNQY